MGALTLKSFPFELRGWDIEKFESIDPTDGFGSGTRVYISKQQIIQIEPDHSENTSKAWLSDKGRQFFDGILYTWKNKNRKSKKLIFQKESLQKSIKVLLKTLYLFEHCAIKTKKNYFLTLVFENLGLETLSLLKIMEQNYSFLKLRKVEKLNMSNDLEFNFQLNATASTNQLKFSTLCLLVSTNPRYEGYHLNLDLRQRYLKGNFKCLLLGSLINLTFPNKSIGTSLKTLRNITEGNSLACQDFKTAKNPLLIFNTDLSERTDGVNIIKMFRTFEYANIFNRTWNGLNTLNSRLSEVGIQSIARFLPLRHKDFNEVSSFYFINVNADQVPNLRKITEAKLLGYNRPNSLKKLHIKKLFLDQNSCIRNNQLFWQNSLDIAGLKQYNFLPTKMFYENEETFINTEGFIKRTNKLLANKKTKKGWKLLRNLSKQLKTTYVSLVTRNTKMLSFNSNKQLDFLNFTSFQYCAVGNLNGFISFLTIQNRPFFVLKTNNKFKKKSTKMKNSKLKYWLNDFFTGGRDEYSKNSMVLANCSKVLRTQSTNFF